MADDKAKEAKSGEGILREKVDEYKKAHPDSLPEFDYALLLKSLNIMNESSVLKIARNALSEKREWIPGTETWNVGRVYLSEDHCVTFTVSLGDHEMTVEKLMEELNPINKKLPLKSVPVMIDLGNGDCVKAEDLYAHSLVSSMWAGLPVDIVLCYKHKKEKKQDSR